MKSIEEIFVTLQEKSKEAPISIGEILSILSGKRQSLFIILFCLPFCQPIQIPGLSTPFGIAIAYIGLKMAFGKYAWMPKSITDKTISSHTMQVITRKFLWLLKKMRRWTHPRLEWLSNSFMKIANGLLIFLMGILLALPLPAPFSNLMAAWAIFFLGLGLLEDDGVFIIIGYVISLFTIGFFIAMGIFIKVHLLDSL